MKTLNLEYDPAELDEYGSCPITYAGKEIGLLTKTVKPKSGVMFDYYEAHPLPEIEELLGRVIVEGKSLSYKVAVNRLTYSLECAIVDKQAENPEYGVTYTATAPDELSALLGVKYIVEPTKENENGKN